MKILFILLIIFAVFALFIFYKFYEYDIYNKVDEISNRLEFDYKALKKLDNAYNGWEFYCRECYSNPCIEICADKTIPIYKNGKYSFRKSICWNNNNISSLECLIYYNEDKEPILHIIVHGFNFYKYSICAGKTDLEEIKLAEKQKKRDYEYLKEFTKLYNDDTIRNLQIVKDYEKKLDEDYKNCKCIKSDEIV